jgi:hypothetical protein
VCVCVCVLVMEFRDQGPGHKPGFVGVHGVRMRVCVWGG